MTSFDDPLHRGDRSISVHIEHWVARGVIYPSQSDHFDRVDAARVRLLSELVEDIGFDDEAAETVVTLLDQLHASRRQLKLLGDAISQQPAATRQAIAEALRALASSETPEKE